MDGNDIRTGHIKEFLKLAIDREFGDRGGVGQGQKQRDDAREIAGLRQVFSGAIGDRRRHVGGDEAGADGGGANALVEARLPDGVGERDGGEFRQRIAARAG